ncbi:ROK family protein [Actinomadura macrotermitis]|uniref:Glucokinase n=1 Tax=Actinomadura macrotermitis TaxID=2585200 RepID=A0A7K0C320_9ACTN|nr:ROK family protein [Actinomadura macrotermitis]MQY07877.1 Glucokinase [Actinomadura macrotermitis]
MSDIIALDVGGTSIKAALLGEDGEIRWWRSRPTGGEHGPDRAVETIAGFAAGLCREAARNGRPAAAVGLALPGIVDESEGTGVYSATLGWRAVPFRDLVAERTGLPVAVGHDVRAGGVAEGRLGAGQGRDRFLFVAIGTSIAAAHVTAGRADPGAHHRSGEIGHLPVRPQGEPCPCGARGCAERYASAAAVARRYAAATGEHAEPEEIARAAAAGEPAAAAVWREAAEALADALLVACTVVDPSLVVVGGGLAGAGDLLLDPVRRHLRRTATFQVVPDLVRARLGDRAGCIGAGLLAGDLLRARRTGAAARP